jgi:hypothetical protein
LMTAKASPLPADNDRTQLYSTGSTWDTVTSKDMRVTIPMIQMPRRRKKHFNPMMDQGRFWRTEGILHASMKIGQHISDP